MQAPERNDGLSAARQVLCGGAVSGFVDNVDIGLQLKRYIGAFRVRELHESLLRLGLKTTGAKQKLVERLTAYLDGEQQAGYASDPTPWLHGVPRRLHAYCPAASTIVSVFRDMKGITINEQLYRANGVTKTIRCVCGVCTFNAAEYKTLTCVTPQCGAQEHIYCLFPSKKFPEWSKENHRCIKCRTYFADPFWMSAKPDDLIPPTVIPATSEQPFYSQGSTIGSKSMVREFSLSHMDLMNVQSAAVKIQLDDPVQFRYHWPLNCKLAVNGKEFRVYPRHADNKVTDGQRDEPADISKLVMSGRNTIEISCVDVHPFAINVQFVVPVDRDVVLNFMHQPENLEASIMRMRRIVRGAPHPSAPVTSFSHRRIQNPGRLLNIDSLECVFDLDAFVTMAQKTRKWACPHSLRQSSVHHLVKDVWLEAVLKCLRNLPDVHEIEVSKEGTWRLRGESRWRSVYKTAIIESLPESIAAHIPKPMDVQSDDESEDEIEELRKAAMDAKSAFKKHYQSAAKSSLEVVDLVSSDEETDLRKYHPSTSQLYSIDQRMFPLSGSASEPLGRNVRVLPAAYSMDDPHILNQASKALARQIGWTRSEVTSIHTLPPPLGTNGPPNPSVSYPAPRFLQRRHMVHPPGDKNSNIVVTQRTINIPSNVISRLPKRPAEWREARNGFRKTERKTRPRSVRGFVEGAVQSQMECIEIDDSE